MYTAGHKMVIVVIIHSSKLKHLLNTMLKVFVCLLTDASVSTDVHMHIDSVPVGGAFRDITNIG